MNESERRSLVAAAEFGRKRAVSSAGGVAITSSPIATRVAVECLRSGGNATDAALAASAAQTVVEPHMTTITGVLGMLHHAAATGEVTYVNGNLNAPLAPLQGFRAADLEGGRGVGVGGWIAAFEASRARHGSMSRDALLAPAIELARDGFEIYPFLYGMMFEQIAPLGRSAVGRDIYFADGALKSPGQMIVQRDAADTLERFAADGPEPFYRGEFAKRFVDVVRGAGGILTMEDLDHYEVRWMEPVRGTYRGLEVVAAPPPDNGGAHIIEALNMIELLDLPGQGRSTESIDTLAQMMLITESVKAEGAKQNDPASHELPIEVILSKEYARARLSLLRMSIPMELKADPLPGSNHVTVVDAAGNAASVLHSCMAMPWSNGLFVDGVSICAGGGHFTRTMPLPGNRISSYGAPNMVRQDGVPLLVSGSPGVGLLQAIVQNIVNIVDFGDDIETSVHRPRFGSVYLRGQMIEADFDDSLIAGLRELRMPLEVVNPWSFHNGTFEGIHIDPASGVRSACADPRRAGAAETQDDR
ncbi:MAG TPA: gamma-glutamyltransferase [Acidimicrobiales bacterium]|nr:gamma-glutamyltransferase [Acidimicrobiales bacterium]